MKKIFNRVFISTIIISVIFLIICLFFYTENPWHKSKTIDLNGSNGFWKASLNIHLKYDIELIIEPKRDDFNIPLEININIIVDENVVYNNTLNYIPNTNEKMLGKYMIILDSSNYFHKNIQEVYLEIIYDDNKSSILLN